MKLVVSGPRGESWIGRSGAARWNPVDKHGRWFIVAFAELFNRHFVPLNGLLPGRRQNGFTTANTTMKIMSIVGASFKNR